MCAAASLCARQCDDAIGAAGGVWKRSSHARVCKRLPLRHRLLDREAVDHFDRTGAQARALVPARHQSVERGGKRSYVGRLHDQTVDAVPDDLPDPARAVEAHDRKPAAIASQSALGNPSEIEDRRKQIAARQHVAGRSVNPGRLHCAVQPAGCARAAPAPGAAADAADLERPRRMLGGRLARTHE